MKSRLMGLYLVYLLNGWHLLVCQVGTPCNIMINLMYSTHIRTLLFSPTHPYHTPHVSCLRRYFRIPTWNVCTVPYFPISCLLPHTSYK